MNSLKDIMLMFSLSERTVRRYLSEGLISGSKVGGVWRFTDEDIESFFTEKKIRNKMKSEVNKLLYDFINTPNPQKKDNHCFSMIDVRLTTVENIALQKSIYEIIKRNKDLQMRYYSEDGNCRYIFVGDLNFIEEVTVQINEFTKKAAN